MALEVALAPCTLGYAAVGKMLAGHPETKKAHADNLYWAWIQNYVADDFVESVRLASGKSCREERCWGVADDCAEQMEDEAARQSTVRVEELVKIFIQGMEVSIVPATSSELV